MEISQLTYTICILDKTDRMDATDMFVGGIDKTLCLTEKGKEFHEKNKVKLYSVSELKPYKKEYSKGDICYGVVRSVNPVFCKYLKDKMSKMKYGNLVMCNITYDKIENKKIYALKTQSLCTILIPGVKGYWRGAKGVTDSDFETQIINGITKKFKVYTGQDISNLTFWDVFNRYEFKNSFIKRSFKGKCYLGDSLILYPNITELAQKICNFLIGVGLGLKCPRGMGFLETMDENRRLN